MYRQAKKRRRGVFSIFTLEETCLEKVGSKPAVALTRERMALANTFTESLVATGKVTREQFSEVKTKILETLLAQGVVDDNTLPEGFLSQTFERLSMRYSRITDNWLCKSAAFFSGLHTLDLQGCYELKDSGVSAALGAAPLLHTLFLTGCRQLTSAIIDHVLLLRRLRIVDLGGLFNLTPQDVVRLIRRELSAEGRRLRDGGANGGDNGDGAVVATAAAAAVGTVGGSLVAGSAITLLPSSAGDGTMLQDDGAGNWAGLHLSGLGLGDLELAAIAAECPALQELSFGFSSITDRYFSPLIPPFLINLFLSLSLSHLSDANERAGVWSSSVNVAKGSGSSASTSANS